MTEHFWFRKYLW